MVVDPKITLTLHLEGHAAVFCESSVHVVEEANAGGNIDDLGYIRARLTVEVDGDLDLCLVRLPGH